MDRIIIMGSVILLRLHIVRTRGTEFKHIRPNTYVSFVSDGHACTRSSEIRLLDKDSKCGTALLRIGERALPLFRILAVRYGEVPRTMGNVIALTTHGYHLSSSLPAYGRPRICRSCFMHGRELRIVRESTKLCRC